MPIAVSVSQSYGMRREFAASRTSEPAKTIRNLWNELQLSARRAVPRGLRQQSSARVASVRQCRRSSRSLQSPTRHVTIYKECVPHERLGHTARVFGRILAGRELRRLAGGTEPQRQRVAMTFQNPDQSMSVHRLCGDRLEELARIRL